MSFIQIVLNTDVAEAFQVAFFQTPVKQAVQVWVIELDIVEAHATCWMHVYLLTV